MLNNKCRVLDVLNINSEWMKHWNEENKLNRTFFKFTSRTKINNIYELATSSMILACQLDLLWTCVVDLDLELA